MRLGRQLKQYFLSGLVALCLAGVFSPTPVQGQTPVAVTDYRDFEAQFGRPTWQARFTKNDTAYFEVFGPVPLDQAAAPAVYIFDTEGNLVDWNADSSKPTVSFTHHWQEGTSAATPMTYRDLADALNLKSARVEIEEHDLPQSDALRRFADWLESIRQRAGSARALNTFDLILLVFLALLSGLAFLFLKWVLKKVLDRIQPRMHHSWRADILDAELPQCLIHIFPLSIATFGAKLFFASHTKLYSIIENGLNIYAIFIVCMCLSAISDACFRLLQRNRTFAGTPIKGAFQAIDMLIYAVGAIMSLATLLDKSPALLLSGLGALTAVLMVIFKDTLLGFTAGIMLSGNRMVRLGDWIEMPSANADGDVIDVSLTTVKVQNWDKTITTIPAYDLISHSFKNWRGMFEIGGRRIKRAIFLDMQSITFADEEMIHDWLKIDLLKPYLDAKLKEIKNYNTAHPESRTSIVNARRITNIGTFRAYCVAYLTASPLIRKDMTLLVRQLALTPQGLPLEIYVFSANTSWIAYEGIQSDIFDHLISILPIFRLSVYQEPSGNNFGNIFKAVSTLPETESSEALEEMIHANEETP